MLHRVHWGIKIKNKNRLLDNENVTDIFLFLRSLKSYAKQFNTKNIYITWDKRLDRNTINFRHKLTTNNYKAQRNKKLTKEVYEHEEDLLLVLKSLGVKNMYPQILEADDIISWLCKKLEGTNVIVTTDNDLLQLITEKTILFNPSKKILIDENNFEKIIGIKSKYFLVYKAILGDVSDNISGIKGYGKVRAKKLAKRYIDKTCDKLPKEYLHIIQKNIKLMDLSQGYIQANEEPMYQLQFNKLTSIKPDLDKFKEYCEKFNFNTFLKNFDQWEGVFKESRLFSIINSLATNK